MLPGMHQDFLMTCFAQGFAHWGSFDELGACSDDGNDSQVFTHDDRLTFFFRVI
jgi:hypothetical protein